MGATQSKQQEIFDLARSGKHEKLKTLLVDLQQNEPQYRTNRAAYIEAQDDVGNTPLVVAAARGAYACVQLLIEQGANQHHQNRRGEGGSALHEAVAGRHDHVVDLLLRCGASPFIENAKGFTAIDIACASRNFKLVRRLEAAAPFRGWLLMKVPKFAGLGSCWERRWCVICHRYPYPLAPPAQQLTHVVFLAYKSESNTAPACRAWLDGAKAREFYHAHALARLSCQGVAQIAIDLHRNHDVPAGAYVTGSATGRGYTFYLRPDAGDASSVAALQRFMDLVNNRGFAPVPTAQQQHSPPQQAPAAGQMATAPGVWSAPGPLQQGSAAVSSGYQATVGGAAGDEDYARRLQEQFDQEAASHFQNNPQADVPASTPPSYTTSAAGTPHADGSGDARYPRPFGPGPSSLPLTPHASGRLQGSGGSGSTAAGGLAGSSSAPSALIEGPTAPPLVSLPSPRPDAAATAPLQPTASVSNWWQDLPPVAGVRPLQPTSSSRPAASEHPATPAPAPPAPVQQAELDDDKLCVICLEFPATAGVWHGDSVHKCLCSSCAARLKADNVQQCPMCRSTIGGWVMNVY